MTLGGCARVNESPRKVGGSWLRSDERVAETRVAAASTSFRHLSLLGSPDTMRALARLVAAAAQAPSAASSSSAASRAVCARAGHHLAGAREWRTPAIAGGDALWTRDGPSCRARVSGSRAFGTSRPFAVSASSARGADDGAGADASSRRDSGSEPTRDVRPTGETYEAHLAETVKNVKLLSLASLAATVCGTPLLLELASPDMLPEAKMTVSLVVDGFGTFTTALLQWFVSPYVLTMRVEKGETGPGPGPASDVVVVEKLSLFARRFEDRFPAAAMREAETTRPLVTWEANGSFHYVEMANVPRCVYDRLDLERFDDQARALRHAERAASDEDDEDE